MDKSIAKLDRYLTFLAIDHFELKKIFFECLTIQTGSVRRIGGL
jgi:hypothetical protein